jgi:MFS family permease
VALAAILVQAPRLVLAVLAADRQPVDVAAERALLVVAGVGTALVLTGGNLYLAHAIARVRRWRRALAAVWLAVLVSTGGLVVPLVAAGLAGRTLPQLLGSEGLAWSWSLLAALAHEVTAAGCVLAAAAAASERSAAERIAAEQSQASELDELLRQRDAARRELAALRELAERRERLARSEQVEQQQTGAGHQLPAAGSGARYELPAAGRGERAGACELAPLRACPEGCGRSFAGAAALAGHLRHCAVRRERLRRLAASEV